MRHRRKHRLTLLEWLVVWLAGAVTACALLWYVIPVFQVRVDENGNWTAIEIDWNDTTGRKLYRQMED